MPEVPAADNLRLADAGNCSQKRMLRCMNFGEIEAEKPL